MGVFNKFKDLVGLEEYEEEEMEYEEETYKPPQTSTTPRYNTSNVVPMQNKTVKSITNAFKLVVIEPSYTRHQQLMKLVIILNQAWFTNLR